MRNIIKLLAGTAALAGVTAAAPASAQYYNSNGYTNPYSSNAYGQSNGYNAYQYNGANGYNGSQYGTNGYSQYNGYNGYNGYNQYGQNGYNQYGRNAYNQYNGYNTAVSQTAVNQCSAAVQSRLYNRTTLASVLGSLVGIPANQGRVLSVTSTTPTRYGMRIRGLATSGRYESSNSSPYGVGAYGSLGYNSSAAADLSFKCDVDANGNVRDVSVNRR